MSKDKKIKEKISKSENEKLIEHKKTKASNSKGQLEQISTDKESNPIIRVFNNMDIKNVNESMKLLASLGGFIVSFLTIYLEVRDSNLASESSDYYKISKAYFLGSSNKITMSIYYLLVFSIILSLFLMPLMFKIFYKDKKISKSNFKFYSNLISIFFAIVVTSRIMFLHISLTNYWNYLIAPIIWLVSYIICRYVINNFVIRFIGVDELDDDKDLKFSGFFKDMFYKDNKFLLFIQF